MTDESASLRIESLDVLRGVTILAMIFVNDIAGVSGAPAWMKHIFPSTADGMTFADLVYPAFLFIAGMAIPFAISRRLERSEHLRLIWKHILTRTLSLLVIGFFMVNTQTISSRAFINPHLWGLLMYAGVIIFWNTPRRSAKPNHRAETMLKVASAGLLVTLVVLYRGNGVEGFFQMRPQWWGILGQIGWAYLVGCAVYLLLKSNRPAMVGVMTLLYCFSLADKAGFLADLTWLTQWIDIGPYLGSHGAIVVSGTILGMTLAPGSAVTNPLKRMRWALFYGLGLAAGAVLLHSLHTIDSMFIINKNLATVPWCLWSSAITTWTWIAVSWIMDVQKWKGWWSALAKEAGRNALFAYILAPFFYSLFYLLNSCSLGFDFYGRLGSGFFTGLGRSLVFAFLVTWLAGRLSRRGVKLRV